MDELPFIPRRMIVDDHNVIFDARGMKFVEFPSAFERIREYAAWLIREAPEEYREENLLEQQLSEIIKNGIKHGNRSDPAKKIRIWYDLRNRARFIIEDEGEGFVNLDDWNRFFTERQLALYNKNMEDFFRLASYKGPMSDENDGGNSLIAALDYWNGGMIYNKKKNKVAVVRWFSQG
jgi:hypothetical protein